MIFTIKMLNHGVKKAAAAALTNKRSYTIYQATLKYCSNEQIIKHMPTFYLAHLLAVPHTATYHAHCLLRQLISGQLHTDDKFVENFNPKDRCAIHHFYFSSPSQLHLSLQWWWHHSSPPPHHSPHPADHWTACWGCFSQTWADKEFKHPPRETVQLVKSQWWDRCAIRIINF